MPVSNYQPAFHQLLCVTSRDVQSVPVGFHLISPLNRPISSSSVHGSFKICSSAVFGGESAAGVGVFCTCAGDAGEVAAVRARFLGGIASVDVVPVTCGSCDAQVKLNTRPGADCKSGRSKRLAKAQLGPCISRFRASQAAKKLFHFCASKFPGSNDGDQKRVVDHRVN